MKPGKIQNPQRKRYCELALARARELRALADRTENVEQLEAIERDLEKLISQARRVAGSLEIGVAQKVTKETKRG